MKEQKTVRANQDAMAAFGDALTAAAKSFEEQTGIKIGSIKRERYTHNTLGPDGKLKAGDDVWVASMSDVDGRIVLMAPPAS